MRLNLFFIVLSISVLFSNCSSSDDSTTIPAEVSNEELIIGEWKYSRYEYEEDGEIIVETLANECTSQGGYVFSANGDYLRRFFGGVNLDDCDGGETNGTYTIAGDILSLSTFEYDASIEINSSTLVLKFIACNFDCENYNYYYYDRIEE